MAILRYLLLFGVCCMNLTSFAHEGHKEASLKSFHGGIVKKTTNTFVEVLQIENEIQVYVRDHDDKPIAHKDLKFSGQFRDSKKKNTSLVLEDKGKFFIIKNPIGNNQFFSITFEISGKHMGQEIKSEKVVFNLEKSVE